MKDFNNSINSISLNSSTDATNDPIDFQYVVIYCWNSANYAEGCTDKQKAQRNKFGGHTAIKAHLSFNQTQYLSFQPKEPVNFLNCCELWSTPGACYTQKTEELHYGRPEGTYVLRGLNVVKIYDEIIELRKKLKDPSIETSLANMSDFDIIEDTDPTWGISPNSYLCSSIIAHLLQIGGLNERMPSYGQIGNIEHLLLLIPRPAFAVSTLSALFYAFLAMHSNPSTHYNVDAGVALATIITSITLLDKYLPLITSNVKLGLSEKSCRTRELVEFCSADIAVQVVSQVLTGFAGMGFRALISADPQIDNFAYSFGLDFLGWLVVNAGAYLSSSYLLGNFIYLCAGTKAIVRPDGLEALADYLQKTEQLNKEQGVKIRKLQFKKELAVIINLGFAAIMSYLARRYFHDPETSFLKGTVPSLLLGYFPTRYAINKINSQQQYLNISPTERKKYQEILNSHDPKPGQFTLTSTGAVTGIMLFMIALQASYSKDPMLNGLISTLGGLLGYILGLYLYEGTIAVKDYCPDNAFFRFFSPNTNSENFIEFTDNIPDALLDSNSETESNNGINDIDANNSFHNIM